MSRHVTPVRWSLSPLWCGYVDLGALQVPVRTDRVELASWSNLGVADINAAGRGSETTDRCRIDLIGMTWAGSGAPGSVELAVRSGIACGPEVDVALGTLGPATLPGLVVQVDGVLTTSWSLWGRVIPAAGQVGAQLDLRALCLMCCVPYGLLRGSLLP